MLFVAALGVEDVYKGQHILKRDVALDGVGWGENIAAEAAFTDMIDSYPETRGTGYENRLYRRKKRRDFFAGKL